MGALCMEIRRGFINIIITIIIFTMHFNRALGTAYNLILLF